jgi:hypothetical protein
MLPFDEARCWGVSCPKKDICQRYIDRTTGYWDTPMYWRRYCETKELEHFKENDKT